jgi:DNA-binding transcriptional LysR family regulator
MLYDQRALDHFRIIVEHGGITKAVTKISYGITRSSLSRQMIELEKEWHARLFERMPFELTPEGRDVYRVACLNHENLVNLARKMSRLGPVLRIASSAEMVQKYLNPIVDLLTAHEPTLSFMLRSGSPAAILHWVSTGRVDLAVMPAPDPVPAGLDYTPVVSANPVLVVPADSPYRTAEDVLVERRLDKLLVTPEGSSPIRRAFDHFLARHGIRCRPRWAVTWLDIIHLIVSDGRHCGLTIDVPSAKLPAEVRKIPLPGIEPVTIGVLCREGGSAGHAALLSALIRHGHRLWAYDLRLR